ncbi:MAG: hypothetical protein ACFFCS_16275 [Candidatus Hodarchaeota archaeon]
MNKARRFARILGLCTKTGNEGAGHGAAGLSPGGSWGIHELVQGSFPSTPSSFLNI